MRQIWIAVAVVISALACGPVSSQVHPPSLNDHSEDNPQGNVHLGSPIVIPLNPTARAVHLGFGLNVGGGYNFTRRHALVGEYMWNDLFPTNEALAKVRTALNDRTLDMSVAVHNLTANYRYELRGQSIGTYFMGGTGLYYRHTHLSRDEITGANIQCTPTWEWWGFECSGGYVKENQTIGSWSATGPGFNGGIGFTFRVGEPPYRFYAESRYHYAPNSRLNMQLIDITFGIRY